MTTAHPSLLAEGPYAAYDLPTTSIIRVAAMVNFKTSPICRQSNGTWNGCQHKKSKIITESTNISADITKNGQELKEVTGFTDLGTILCKEGTCSAEVRISFAPAMAAMARLNRI